MKDATKNIILEAPFMNRERLGADFGNTVVVSPHPDDESLGCGGLIALLREAGAVVSVIFVTDGCASHTSKTHPPAVLREIRESEAIHACAVLGVDSDSVHFLKAPDSGLSLLNRAQTTVLVEAITILLVQNHVKTIALPWRRDPHPDHRAVYHIGTEALQNANQKTTKLEYPIWLWKNGASEDWPVHGEISPYRLDISPVLTKKLAAIDKHASQLGKIINDDKNGFVLTDALLEPFKGATEYYFATRRKLRSLDENYFDELYTDQTDPWNFRTSAYELEKYKKTIASLGPIHFKNGLELGCSIGIQTEMLSKRCTTLTAIDISEIAVQEAKKSCAHTANITFIVGDVVKKFPVGNFDLITCCEIGYYLTLTDLDTLFHKFCDALDVGGRLMLVHWTPFVPDYPISGDQVHDSFEKFASTTRIFRKLINEREDFYRLDIWEKTSGVSAL